MHYITLTINPDWRTDTVNALATQMCIDKNYSALPILADALQDADCNDEILLHDLRNITYPKAWLAHLITYTLETAPLPNNPIDQGELFTYLKQIQKLTATEIARRFHLYITNRDGTPTKVLNTQYVRDCIFINNSRVHHTDRKKVREGKKTAAWLAKKFWQKINGPAQTK